MYRCIIIDDEPHAIEGLKGYVETIAGLNLVKCYTEPLNVLNEIDGLGKLDLIFLDVDMPMISGIELAREIRSKTDRLIFTTAHTKYAFEAFEANADAYLLKPYTLGKFAITVHKLFPKLNEQKPVAEQAVADFFFVKSKEDNLKLIRINFADVIAVESKQNYILIHTVNKDILTYLSLTEMVKVLAHRKEFVQLHRSFVINDRHIEYVDGNTISIKKGIRFSIGDYYKDNFKLFMESKILKAGKQL